MRLHRTLLALALTATVGLASGCAEDTSTDQAATAAASSAAVPSPTLDLKANTEAVCKGLVAVYEAEKTEIVTVLSTLVSAGLKGDKAATADAKAKGEVVLARVKKAADAELAKAADPAAKAALETYVTTFAKQFTVEALDDAALEAEMDKATAEAVKYCPALDK
ncbi:hypothetical protein [Dactylosporangium sp. NPDC005555]|uniref:hypothetical protein n=1 Tax=Dactylosporangium sp. NPDC005555 TaxID=3154889 RepID=UPI0033BE29EC